MGKVYVHVEATVTPDGAGAKAAITKELKKKLEALAVKYLTAGVPKKGYTTKDSEKPKTKGVYNALKADATFKIKAEPKGSKTKVSAGIKVLYEAIKMPKTKPGSLISSQSGGTASVENAGSGEKVVESSVDQLLDAMAGDAIAKTLGDAAFKKRAGDFNLDIDK